MGDTEKRESDAPFNMAMATLMRLDTILQQLRVVDILYPNDTPEKQKFHIGLIKQFYINAIPLLKDSDAEDYKKEILGIEVKVTSSIKAGNQRSLRYYDKQTEIRLNEILIELQVKLKKYFMPKARDPGKSVIEY